MTTAVPVAIAGRPYDVLIGESLVEQAGALALPLLRRARLAVVTDETVRDLHGARLDAAFVRAGISVDWVIIESGEGAKSFAGLAALTDQLLALQLERGDLIVAFGGGVVGDLAGFAAAIFKRGIDFVQIPTTLLAQVDSSVGGKTAIDTPRGKNLVGAFHQPRLVLADLSVLETLPRRELLCGYAEVIKYGLLGDLAFFEWLEANGPQVLSLEPQAVARAVRRSVEMKAEIVAEDEREMGRRALLNLGHTFGHALEAATGFSETLKHGEAVALGCGLAFRFSAHLGLCSGQDAERAARVIAAAGLPSRLADIGAPGVRDLVSAMAQDKKAEGGALTFILARRLGDAFIAKDVDSAQLADFLIREGALP